MSVFTEWKSQVMGTPIDVDGSYGQQCVDVAMSYAQAVFYPHQWPELLGYGNAKDLFSASNDAFFEKIANDPNDPNQLPQQGDIIVYGETSTNPYGHIAIVDAADSGGVNEVEQNGFNPTGSVYEIYRRWGRSPCIGWLRPKDLSPAPEPQPEPVVVPEPSPIEQNPPTPATNNAPVEDPVSTTTINVPLTPVPAPVVESPSPLPTTQPTLPNSQNSQSSPSLPGGWFQALISFLIAIFKKKG